MSLKERRAAERLAREEAKLLPPPPPATQVERIARRFGGFPRLIAALNALPDQAKHRHRAQVYRWNHPKSKGGCGGLIPTQALRDVMEAARREGLVITPEDLFA